MRRAALAACCTVLASVLLVPSANAASTSGDRHFAPTGSEMAITQCLAWKTHRKRVVKRVRQSGEWKRVVRVKRWRTCKRRVAPVPVVPAPALPSPEPQPEPEDPTIPRLGVKAVEWAYTLSRPEVPAGEVVVELNNMGEDPHNLNLQLEDESGPEEKITTVGPSAQGIAKFNLPAGAYRLWCDLDGHEAAGMKATLIVSG